MRLLLIVTTTALFMGGCGTKGPLYLPKPDPGAQQPGPVILPPTPPERPTPAETAPTPK